MAGVRYEEWLNNDTNAAVPKFGVRWQPFDESLTLRSTWGEGFLEPSMVQLYGPRSLALGRRTLVVVALLVALTLVVPCPATNRISKAVVSREPNLHHFPIRN